MHFVILLWMYKTLHKKNDQRVNYMNKTVHIIAEAGTNHNGSLKIAKQLVDVSKKSKADSIKFQIIYPDKLYLPKIYIAGKYVENEVYQKRIAGMLTDDEYDAISEYCGRKKIAFGASVFDEKGINLLDKLNAPYIKIASCDINNSSLLKQAAERMRKLIVSTGMATLREIEKAVTDIVKTGNTNIVLMHCVSVYPARTEIMNLKFIEILKQAFGFPVGLSDHTEESIAAVISISMGTEWIEKHFTLNRDTEGFDHAYAMEPESLKRFIKDIRAATKACQKQKTKIQKEELTVKSGARRSLYAARDIKKGEVLTDADILIVRPEGKLNPNDFDKIVGSVAKCSIKKYMPLSYEMF